MERMSALTSSRAPWFTGGVALIALVIGWFTGWYMQGVRLDAAIGEYQKHIDESRTYTAAFQSNLTLDAVQEQRLNALEAAMRDLSSTNKEIRDLLVLMVETKHKGVTR